MMAGLVFSGLLEVGTAAPAPVRRERWLTHVGYMVSETSLPERLATYVDHAATTSVPSGTAIRAEIGAVMNRLAIASILPISEEAQAAVDAMVEASMPARPATRVIKRRSR
jgi:hypothetical protein